jgi:hypothetical protein
MLQAELVLDSKGILVAMKYTKCLAVNEKPKLIMPK